MKDYVAISLSVTTDHIARIHIAGCGDIAKDSRSGGNTIENISAASAKDAVAKYISGDLDEMGYMASDVKVLSCAR